MAFSARSAKAPRRLRVDPSAEGIAVPVVTYWAPPSGLDLLHKPNRIGKQYAAECLNMMLEDDRLISRRPYVILGTLSTEVMAAMKFITSRGVGYTLRFRRTAVERWTGSAWTALPGTYPLTATTSDYYTWTPFGDTLLFSQGKEGIYEFDALAGVVAAISGAPAAYGLTTFTGRVVAWNVRDPNWEPNRIKWSVKNNSHGWTGIGSGFEDLLSTPGGEVDRIMHILPITDTIALIFRSKSIWQMVETGVASAPFRFSRLHDNIGTESPRSIVMTPYGVVMVGVEDVYLISGTAAPIPVGDVVRTVLFSDVTDRARIVGAFDRITQSYRMVAPSGLPYEYRLSFRPGHRGWTRHNGNGILTHVAYGRKATAPRTIDGLTALSATIDGLTAVSPTIDGLSGTATDGIDGMIFTTDTAVVLESASASTDDYGAGPVAATVDLVTAQLSADRPLWRKKIIEAQLEYDAVASQTLIFEYSTDGGATFSAFGAPKAITSTTEPKLLKVTKTLVHRDLQIRVRSETLGKLRVHGLHLSVLDEAPAQ